MTAQVIPFPDRGPRGDERTEPPHPYDFWFPLLEDMTPARRKATIERAYRCGVIDGQDREIFLTSWLDLGGAS